MQPVVLIVCSCFRREEELLLKWLPRVPGLERLEGAFSFSAPVGIETEKEVQADCDFAWFSRFLRVADTALTFSAVEDFDSNGERVRLYSTVVIRIGDLVRAQHQKFFGTKACFDDCPAHQIVGDGIIADMCGVDSVEPSLNFGACRELQVVGILSHPANPPG